MNEKEIQEGNRLIALFDGYRYMTNEEKMNWCSVPTIERLNKLPKENVPIMTGGKHGVVIYESTLQYHSSWDWLIPACKKFQNLVMNKQIEPSEEFTQHYESIENAGSLFEREHLFRTLVEAIQWYNNQNK